MPNTRRQIVGAMDNVGPAFANKVGIHITASDGRAVTITRAQVLAHWQGEAGTLAVRKAATIAWIRQQIEAALGAEQVGRNSIASDFDVSDGSPSDLTVTG